MNGNEVDLSDGGSLLKAVEVVVADPEKIKKEALQILEKVRKSNSSLEDADARRVAADKIISKYSYYSAFSGGLTALAGVIPGLGTAVSVTGGATADLVASIKFQVEMTMAIATIYDYDIGVEENKKICFLVAGLGAIGQAAKEGGKQVGSKAFVKMTQQYLQKGALVAVKEVFKRIGISFTKKAMIKAIPFGVGVVVGSTVNKGLALYVGSKAIDFFEATSAND